MKKSGKKQEEFVYTFSKEKLDEFRDMSAKSKLAWLEDANTFINKTLGIKKRALADGRFTVFLKSFFIFIFIQL